MRCAPALAVLALGAGLLAACTSGSSTPTRTTVSTSYRTITNSSRPSTSASSSAAIDPTPVSQGPTTSANGVCPFIATQAAADQFGARLDRVTVQRAGGRAVGCRLYGLQHPNAQCGQTCLQGENLPPANQPVIAIDVVTYLSATDAHNATALTARKGANPQQETVAPGNVGVCYQTAFWAEDDGKDWACAFSTGTRAFVVRTVAAKTSSPAVAVTKVIAAAA